MFSPFLQSFRSLGKGCFFVISGNDTFSSRVSNDKFRFIKLVPWVYGRALFCFSDVILYQFDDKFLLRKYIKDTVVTSRRRSLVH